MEPHISEHLLHVQKNLTLLHSQSGNGSQHAAGPALMSVCLQNSTPAKYMSCLRSAIAMATATKQSESQL